jgi:hypothetical protein
VPLLLTLNVSMTNVTIIAAPLPPEGWTLAGDRRSGRGRHGQRGPARGHESVRNDHADIPCRRMISTLSNTFRPVNLVDHSARGPVNPNISERLRTQKLPK